MSGSRETVRLDKWLWHARFFRTRGMATAEVGDGHVRVNGQRTVKPPYPVGVGDTLTFPQGEAIRVVRVTALAERRGAARDAQRMYLDLDAGPIAAPSPLE